MMRMKFREVVRLAEFEKDIKPLARRYPTLEEDLETLISTSVFAFHKLNLNMGIVPVEGLGKMRLPVFKVRKFACRSLKGRGARSGLRLVYAFDAPKDRIELVEIYFKADREIEDRARIKQYYSL